MTAAPLQPLSRTEARPPFGEALRVWLLVGLTSFGGPAGQIALMHRILVEQKRWIDEQRFLHALNFCMLLPGPEAQQLATYIGWLLHGIRGGLAAGLLFILPGFLVILALSIVYVALGDVPVVAGMLFGLKAAVLAVVAEALMRVARRALKSRTSVAIAIAAFLAIAFLRLPFPLIVLAAAIFGWFSAREPGAGPIQGRSTAIAESEMRPSTATSIRAAMVWGGVWLLPVAVLVAALGSRNIFAAEALFFSKTAVVTFGGAYAVLAYVAQQAVEAYQWLRPDEMLTGLGLAETTPGPLILVLVFVGFLGAFRAGTGLDPYLAGSLGALTTLWVTFAPSFLFIFVGAPWVEHLRSNRRLAAALAAITAAVVGVIANLGLWFALNVLFGEVRDVAAGPLVLPVPDAATFDPWAAAIAVLTGIGLLRLHLPMMLVLVLAALAGLAVRLIA